LEFRTGPTSDPKSLLRKGGVNRRVEGETDAVLASHITRAGALLSLAAIV